MSVTFNLPDELERHLRHQLGDLNQAAKEAALVELYRQDQISRRELELALGLSRLEAEGVLKQHRVVEDLMTPEEFERQVGDLERGLAE